MSASSSSAPASTASGRRSNSLSVEDFDRTVRVNLRGTFLALHHLVPLLKRAGGGSVVIVSSMNGTRTFTTGGATAYVATKAAQLAMTCQLSLELARHRIRVNCVCPGQITTNIDESSDKRDTDKTAIPVIWPEGSIPLTGGVPGQAADVAEAIVFLASDRSRHITGTPIWIDGGQSLLR